MKQVVISGTGLYTPPYSISNEELVTAFNAYAERFNAEHADAIAAGAVTAIEGSSAAFIEKASGIKSRYVMEKEGILDPAHMTARIAERADEELSLQAEICVAAARDALARARRSPADIDMVLVACSNMQRAYPAMAVEVQAALGIAGFGFDIYECGVLVRHLRHPDRHGRRADGPGARRAGLESGNHQRPPELPRPRQPFHFRRCLHGHRHRSGRHSRGRAPVRDPRVETENGLLEQHPQQFRFHEPF